MDNLDKVYICKDCKARYNEQISICRYCLAYEKWGKACYTIEYGKWKFNGWINIITYMVGGYSRPFWSWKPWKGN